MRIDQVHIRNYRCLDDVTVGLADLTILVGANGAGKSSVLHALRWFFEGGDLDPEDVGGQDPAESVSVSVYFTDLTDADRRAFGSYVVEDGIQLWRTWSPEDGERLTGRGLALPQFEAIRRLDSARERIAAYRDLRRSSPELDLPVARSGQAVDEAMEAYERDHPEDLEEATVSATHLFGFVGQGKLAGRFDFVLVPAVSDVPSETLDGRGTLLRQLVDREGGHSEAMAQRLQEAEDRLAATVEQIVEEESTDTLDRVAASVTSELARLVPAGRVRLEAEPPKVQLSPVRVEMRVTDGDFETHVQRQGHGFQRALMIALVQHLAQVTDEGDPPGLFLAIEEPELYQHPVQARHFARTLAALPKAGPGAIQVAYATHSEHFVDPSHYERLRRFQKELGPRAWPTTIVRKATADRVAERLDGVVPPEQIPLRIRITLRRQLAEAVFAKAVVLVEGPTDAALLHGVADRVGGFDGAGVAVVVVGGKHQLLLPWVILDELSIPVYVVFDGDAGLRDRMAERGKDEADIDPAVQHAEDGNRLILGTLGEDPNPSPPTTVTSSFAVFHDRLETELTAWPSFLEKLDELRELLGDWRDKSEDAYREAAAVAEGDVLQIFSDIVDAILSRASPPGAL